jgi:hypothetical protein
MRFLILIFTLLSITLFAADPVPSSPKIKIALLCAPSVIGRYAQSSYNVTLATFLASNRPFELISYNIKDESNTSLSEVLGQMNNDKVDAVLAPLTLNGVKNLLILLTDKLIFIPTVHKRDVQNAPDNIVFGAIDYQAQIQALVPYMATSVAVFYDDSAVGNSLNTATQTLAHESNTIHS